jgi:hypothetical protein
MNGTAFIGNNPENAAKFHIAVARGPQPLSTAEFPAWIAGHLTRRRLTREPRQTLPPGFEDH